MNRMGCSEAWATMKACLVFMSSPPIEQKNRGLAQNLNILLQSLVVLAKLRQLSGLGILFRDRRD